MSALQVLTCPFCDSKPEVGESYIPRQYACRVRCMTCGVEIIRTDNFTDDAARTKAVAAWNRRGPNPPPADALKVAARALDLADRLLERAYGTDVPQEWNDAYRAVAEARAAQALATLKGADHG